MNKTTLIAILIIALSGYLAFRGLADNYFWDDEAGTAIFARNLLRSGKLTAWDGRNLMAARNGMELDGELINRYFPPLQFYIAAFSFKVFGVSTFSGRLPFVLVGLLSLWVFWLVLRLEARDRISLSLSALLLLALSPSFLLYIRQCRYFSLVIFFPLLIYYCYKRYIREGEPLFLVLLTLGFIGLFFSHYLVCAAFAFALLGLHLKYYLKSRGLLPFLLAGAVFGAVILAYILTAGVVVSPFGSAAGKSWPAGKLLLLGMNFRELNSYGWFPWTMALFLAWVLLGKRIAPGMRKTAREWVWLTVLFVFFVTLLSPQTVLPSGDADVRYLVAVLPFLAALLGLLVSCLAEKCRPAGVLLILLLILTNLLALNFWLPRAPRWDLFNYLVEIHRDYTTAYEATVDFIERDCRPDDVIVVVPPNMSYPLQFYAGGRVIFGGRLDGSTRLPLKKVRGLNPNLILEDSRPDWVISFGRRPVTVELLNYYFRRGLNFDLYEVLDVFYLGEAIRPEILLRRYGPVGPIQPEVEGVLIFKREGRS